uniref:Uncharacterized protein n=1 Tax=Rhodnius prolixus TaxID=13249 RepID=T1HRD3_RHOPR
MENVRSENYNIVYLPYYSICIVDSLLKCVASGSENYNTVYLPYYSICIVDSLLKCVASSSLKLDKISFSSQHFFVRYSNSKFKENVRSENYNIVYLPYYSICIVDSLLKCVASGSENYNTVYLPYYSICIVDSLLKCVASSSLKLDKISFSSQHFFENVRSENYNIVYLPYYSICIVDSLLKCVASGSENYNTVYLPYYSICIVDSLLKCVASSSLKLDKISFSSQHFFVRYSNSKFKENVRSENYNIVYLPYYSICIVDSLLKCVASGSENYNTVYH